MCRLGYYKFSNRLMVTHALGQVIYGYTLLLPMNQKVLHKSSKEYHAHVIYVGFEDSVSHESFLTFCLIKYKKICFINLNGNELMK